ncbi:MAG: flagellar brake protein [Desulfovibrionaceae bacterium]|nr:flagellar brake protein [Desulfovibrionaceae bacterium]
MKNAQVKNLDGSNLAIEPGAVLLMELQGLKTRVKTEFLGMDRGRWIMVRTPAKLGASPGLTRDDAITVRFLKGENLLCGFNTTYLSSIPRPSPLTFLDFPSKYVEMNLRRAQRLDCFLPATLVSDGHEWSGLILNISAGGCMFVVNQQQPTNGLAPGSEVFALYRLPGNDEELFARGTVRNISEFRGRPSLGLSFEELTDEARESVNNFINDLSEFSA